MSVLDTFYMVFDSDASELDKGLDESRKKSEKLKDKVKETDEDTKKLGTSFTSTIKTAVGALAAFYSVGRVIGEVMGAAAAADALGKFSDAIDANIEDVDAWGKVVALSGGSAEGFQGSLSTLTKSLAKFKSTGKDIKVEFLKKAGIDAKDAKGNIKSVFDLLPEIADKMQSMDKQEAFGFGQMLGLDDGTIMTLMQGRDAILEQVDAQKKLGVTTEEDAVIAADFNDSLDTLKIISGNTARELGSFLLPTIKDVFVGLKDGFAWMKSNKTLVQGFFIAIAGIVAAVYLPAMLSAATATIAAFAPVFLIGLAVAAVAATFALLYEDLMVYMEGGDSAIGKLAERFPIVKTLIDGLIEGFKTFWNYIKMGGEIIAAFFTLVLDLLSGNTAAWDTFKQSIYDAFMGFVNGSEIAKAAWDLITGAIDSAIEKIMSGVNKVKDAWAGVKSFFGFGEGGAPATPSAQSPAPSKAGVPALPAGGKGGAVTQNVNTSNKQTVNVGAVTINTQATDAAGIASAVGGSLKSEVGKATAQFNNGVSH